MPYACCRHCEPGDVICERLRCHMAWCDKPAPGSHHDPCQTRFSWIKCISSTHGSTPVPASEYGIFINRLVRNADVEDVWYCKKCAHLLEQAGFFVPVKA